MASQHASNRLAPLSDVSLDCPVGDESQDRLEELLLAPGDLERDVVARVAMEEVLLELRPRRGDWWRRGLPAIG
jgi:hypothetical protein